MPGTDQHQSGVTCLLLRLLGLQGEGGGQGGDAPAGGRGGGARAGAGSHAQPGDQLVMTWTSVVVLLFKLRLQAWHCVTVLAEAKLENKAHLGICRRAAEQSMYRNGRCLAVRV